jgi:predicted transcriptional regulator
MSTGKHILISLEPRYAEGILSGTKQVELRRRKMNVEEGTIVWLYVKHPVASIVGHAKVKSVHSLAPSTLWKRFGTVAGVSRAEFFKYFEGIRSGVALLLEAGERLPVPVSLNRLRGVSVKFHPPQFFIRLHSTDPVLGALRS